MSIAKIIDKSIISLKDEYKDYLKGLNPDSISGSMFMIYALEIIYKDEDFDNIETGIIDSAYRREKHDYGIDAIYIRNNKRFIETPEQLENCNQDSKFRIQIFQFKKGSGIDQASILKLKEGIEKLIIEEEIDEEKNKYLYNRMDVFNDIKENIVVNYPSKNIFVDIFIVFSGNESTVREDDLITTQFEKIKKQLYENAYSNCEFHIVDGKDLIERKKRGNEIVDIISYEKSFKYISNSEDSNKLNGYISIVNGREIAQLVKTHKSALFEANIRDYYRISDLNSKILETSCDNVESKFFWSFNNGLTIGCTN